MKHYNTSLTTSIFICSKERPAMDQTPHIVFLPSPGMGHFFPFLELTKRLVIHHPISATFLIFSDLVPGWSPQEPFLQSLPKGLNHLLLPRPDFNDLPPGLPLHILGALSISRCLPAVRETLKELSSKLNVVAIVADLFGTDAFDIAKEFDISSYLFFTSTAMCLSLLLHLPRLDQSVSCEFSELGEPIRLPGCIPIPGEDVLEPIQKRESIPYKSMLQSVKKYHTAAGIIVNSFHELEPGPFRALQEEEVEPYVPKPLIYPVGPLVQKDSRTHHEPKESFLSNWLDAQPPASVLYICFGSHWTLSQAQMNELALGLETSETQFLWVVRLPHDEDPTSNGSNDPFACLPQGFIERTKERGLIVPYWASQEIILGHESTGGFVTHCGWNSVLESLVNGVPMIAWPLGAEQKMNALMLTDGVEVAMRMNGGEEDGLVGRDEIAKTVNNLMGGEEGKKLRDRTRELKHTTQTTLSEGGSSWNSLADLASKLKTK